MLLSKHSVHFFFVTKLQDLMTIVLTKRYMESFGSGIARNECILLYCKWLHAIVLCVLHVFDGDS